MMSNDAAADTEGAFVPPFQDYSRYRGNRAERNQHGDETYITDTLCGCCIQAFSSSKIMKEALSAGETPEVINEKFAALRTLPREQAFTQMFQGRGFSSDLSEEVARDPEPSLLPEDWKEAAKSRSEELLVHHRNTAEFRSSVVQSKCHFCSLILRIKRQTRKLSKNDQDQDTGVRLHIVSGIYFPKIEVQFTVDDDLWVLEKQYRRLQSGLSSTVLDLRKSATS